MVKEGMHQTIHHQQQSFKAAGEAMVPVQFDLVPLVREAAAGIDLRDGRISLFLELPEELPVVHHRNQLYNGILNILKNAADACGRGKDGKISVKLVPAGSGARLTVADNGSGVLPEHRKKLLSAGFTTKPDGNGLGLHSFAVFLSAHKGKITLTSPGSGLGATAIVEVNHV